MYLHSAGERTRTSNRFPDQILSLAPIPIRLRPLERPVDHKVSPGVTSRATTCVPASELQRVLRPGPGAVILESLSDDSARQRLQASLLALSAFRTSILDGC